MKAKILGLLAVGLLAGPMAANAVVLTYQINVSGNWFDNGGTPFGMPLSPSLTGTLSVNNALSGLSALVDFSLTTGTRTWTESMIAGEGTFFTFNGSGNLVHFGLYSPPDGTGGEMYINSFNTFAVNEQESHNACNQCVSFSSVPEPGSLALLGLGLTGLGLSRKRKAA